MIRTGARSKYPEWDLTDLYTGINDPALALDTKKVLVQAEKFEKTYRDQITEKLTAEVLVRILREYEAIWQNVAKPVIYAELVNSTHADDPTYGAFLQAQRTSLMEVNRHIVFFEVALSRVSEKKLQAWSKDPILQNYQHYLEKQLIAKPHRLSESEEKIMSDKSLTGRAAFIRLFEERLAGQQFTVSQGKHKKTLNQAQVLDLLYSSKRKEREQGAVALSAGFKDITPTVAFIYNMILQDKATDDRYRKFSDPEAERHLANEVKREVVDVAVDTVVKNYRLVHEYYKFKKKKLGVSVLRDYDRYAPVGKENKTYSYPEAKKIVLSAFREFSPEFAAEGEKFFEGNWIDVGSRKGKQGGAYCNYVTPDSHPYLLLNFSGKSREVMTLAHELGHGINAMLMRQQTYLNFDSPLTLAETASVFGEMLVFDYLKKRAKTKQEKLSLLSHRIEDSFATAFRQMGLFRFERLAHAARAKGEVSAQDFEKIWMQVQKEMFGNVLKPAKGYEHWWVYISHFFHTPFYVYSYAFGQLLSLALYAQYQKHGQAMVAAYIHFLRAGGTKSPDELLEELGVNWNTAEFWQGGIDQIAEWVKEVKKL